MYDPTIHSKTIVRHFKPSDFLADKLLLDPVHRAQVVEEAIKLGTDGFAAVALNINDLRGKKVYQIRDIRQNLVLRLITANIKAVTKVKQDDRTFIISCMRSLLSEGTKFRVYKFDIKSFYETVNVPSIIEKLAHDVAFSPQSVRVARSFFEELKKIGVPGLPRGLSLSATLAEYLLRPFDRKMSSNLGVWFYARFVDDMVIITDGKEDAGEFIKLATETLPTGLKFNDKSRYFDFSEFHKKSLKAEEHNFDFLGYSFSVSFAHRMADGKIARAVELDIARSKIKKIKTRIVKSMLEHNKAANFPVLLARVRLLTSNFTFEDRNTGARRISGIYFNYPMVDPDCSNSLKELDRFLRNIIMSPDPRNRARPNITTGQRQSLVRLTFRAGFLNRRFYSFPPKRLAALTSCWAYA